MYDMIFLVREWHYNKAEMGLGVLRPFSVALFISQFLNMPHQLSSLSQRNEIAYLSFIGLTEH